MCPSVQSRLSELRVDVRSFASKAQLRPHPFGEAADCVICLGGAASHHLEAMQHLRKDIEPDVDALVRQPPIHGYCRLKLGRMFSFVRIRKLEEQSPSSRRL